MVEDEDVAEEDVVNVGGVISVLDLILDRNVLKISHRVE